MKATFIVLGLAVILVILGLSRAEAANVSIPDRALEQVLRGRIGP